MFQALRLSKDEQHQFLPSKGSVAEELIRALNKRSTGFSGAQDQTGVPTNMAVLASLGLKPPGSLPI